MNVREYACHIIESVVYEGAYASLMMRQKNTLSKEDMKLASEIVYGTLRNYSYLEYQWEDLVTARVKRKIRVLINMSVYQLQYLDRIPAYAVINEAVQLANSHERGFVNAVLRKVAKRGIRKAEGNDNEQIALETSHPLWLVNLWVKQYGKEQAYKICKADQERPVIYGRVNTIKQDETIFMQKEGVHAVSVTCFTYDGIITELPAFAEGKVLIQDIHSQEVVKHLDVKKGQRILDLCAAPGTKTQQIAALIENDGEIFAFDLHEERVGLIADLMQKTGTVCVKCAQGDATVEKDFPDEFFDRILIDAPCSGLGDLSNKPEIRFHVTPASLDEITKLQKHILEVNIRYLKKGGILVYSTCTLNRKENDKMISSFLREHSEFTLLEENTLFNYEEKGNGFYFASLKKNMD